MNKKCEKWKLITILVCLCGLALPGFSKDDGRKQIQPQTGYAVNSGHYTGMDGKRLDAKRTAEIDQEHIARGEYNDGVGHWTQFGDKNGKIITKEEYIQNMRDQDEWFKNVNRKFVNNITQGVTPGASFTDQQLEIKAMNGTIENQRQLERDLDADRVKREEDLKRYEVPKALVSYEKKDGEAR